jgi:general secretion pathway protein K
MAEGNPQAEFTSAGAGACTRPPSKKRRRRERGAALIMVLGSLVILSVMLAQSQDEMSTEFASALSDRDALKAEYAAKSAINLSRLLIASEPTVRQAAGMLLSLLGGGNSKPPQIPIWEFAPQILGAFNDADGAAQFRGLTNTDISSGDSLGLEGAGFELRIVDEDSKIGLNNAGRSLFGALNVGRQLMGLIGGPQYDPLFDRRSESGEYASRLDICSAIIDWVDANQDTANCEATSQNMASGPEDSYYRNLPDPYTRKNAAFDSLEELRLVRGVGDDFWATFIEPDPGDPGKRPVSVWSQGKININSTNPLTLISYICSQAKPGQELCNDPTGQKPAAFLTTMSMLQSMFAGVPIFRSGNALLQALKGKGTFGPMLTSVGIQPIEFNSDAEFIKGVSIESKVFSIYAEGHVRQAKRETHVRIHAVVDFRKAPTVQDLVNQVTAGATPAPPTPPPTQSGSTTDDDSAGIQGALVPSTAGRVVYYRIN